MKKKYIAAGLAAAALCTGAFAAVHAGYITIGQTLSPAEVDAMVRQSVQTAVQDIEEQHRSEQREKDDQIVELTRQLEEISDSEPAEDPENFSDDKSEKTEKLSEEQVTSAETSNESSIIAPKTQTATEVSLDKNDVSATHSIPNEGTAFEGYAVTVNDWTTPATFAVGKDWPITVWYFFDGDGNTLGSISGESVTKISQQYPTGSIDWEFWLADAFNEFRDLSGGAVSSGGSSSGRGAIDADALALEVIELTNAEREAKGLHALEVNDDLMELAMIRAEEVSEKYSHERPDGTRISQEYGYGENCGAKASPEKQVNSWMNSDGHRTNILLERYNYIGVGCYQKENGNFYWVQVFSP